MAVSLVLTPLVLSRLGMEAYSYWPLCNSLTLYVGLLTISLGPGLRRHTVFALEQGDVLAAREYFNTGLAITCAFWLLIVLAAILISWRLSIFIDIKPEIQSDVQLMFLFIALAASFEVFCLVFFVGAYATDRIYTEKIVRVISPFIRLFFIWGAFAIWKPSLKILGASALIAAAFGLIIAITTYFKYLPEVKIKLTRYVTGRAIRSLTGFGSWILCVALGDYVFRSLPLVLSNRLIDPTAAGSYGIIVQVISLVSANTGHIGYVLSRKLIGPVSRNDHHVADDLLRRYYTWAMGALSLPVALLFVHVDHLFALWIGVHAEGLGDLFRVAIMTTFIAEPISMVNARLLASRRVVTNGISTLLMPLGLYTITLLLTSSLNWGLVGIVIASGIVILVRNVALLIDACLTCNVNVYGIVGGFAVSILAFCGVLLSCYARMRFAPAASFPLTGIIFDFGIGSCVWAIILWSLSRDCRDLVRSLFQSLISRRCVAGES